MCFEVNKSPQKYCGFLFSETVVIFSITSCVTIIYSMYCKFIFGAFISQSRFLTASVHTKNQRTRGWAPVEMLLIHVALILEISSFPHISEFCLLHGITTLLELYSCQITGGWCSINIPPVTHLQLWNLIEDMQFLICHEPKYGNANVPCVQTCTHT